MAQEGADRGRRPTLVDVARLAGVSTALASLALRGVAGPSEQSRERVLRAAEELRYRSNAAASLLARRRSELVGVTCYLDRGFDADVVERLYVEAAERGLDVLLSAVTPSRTARQAIRTLADNRCEAIVCVGSGVVPDDLADLSERVPIVIVGAATTAPHVDVVRTPGDAGTALAVRHLVGLGHTDIAHIAGGTGMSADERRSGYETAMREAGLADRIRVVEGGPGEADGVRAAERLLDGAPPTAVIAYNDAAAVGVLAAARAAGLRVPTDLSVVGYDGSRIAALSYVDLTTVAQDIPGLAAEAVRLADAPHADPAEVPHDVVLAPILIERSSTGPAPR
ncbi:LacI family transcriptional regulator [Pseudoclavibacter chungangensis]|uniref:LacI family transcriptional regulator n=1 Tax=Pseudoclavibacter chungangensis TaxID=587635 RepID=A0A7J5BPK7_9MICO|nr:LacI family DNA-binding transcriptional regulator [Pseudoclavibacter chungangensis]KAB1654043.1 LacI family transcriptional regulator [Pseudoclavibacter chungangensis]NYJ66050.1 DNA-binding LacI/PurR family transcriptional regulator [Pseudoclavibacter chungangensis]